MPRMRSEKELDELITLARSYCEALATMRCAKREGRLSADDEEAANFRLRRMDEKLSLWKSTNEIDRRRDRRSNVIAMAQHKRRVAR